MRFVFLIGLSLLFSTSCGDKNPKPTLAGFEWLVGNWESAEDEGMFTESWSIINDSTFTGNAEFQQNGVVRFSEELRIELRNNRIHYVAILPDKTAFFQLDSLSKNFASFLDAENDFPSRITYRLAEEELVVLLESSLQSNQTSQTLRFTKKQ